MSCRCCIDLPLIYHCIFELNQKLFTIQIMEKVVGKYAAVKEVNTSTTRVVPAKSIPRLKLPLNTYKQYKLVETDGTQTVVCVLHITGKCTQNVTGLVERT